MVRVLALDPGEKRIGLAVSDELGWTAQGLPTLTRRDMQQDLAHLAGLVRDYGVHEIVVGIPYHQDGTLGVGGERAMALVGRLAESFRIAVTPWDERLTTKQAERLLIEGGVSRAKRTRSVDRLAAVLILQSYLDAKRSA